MPVVVSIAIGLGCQDRVADGGTETTNGTIIGKALYSDGNVAAGARVRLRPSGYLAGMNLGPEDSMAKRWETQSDSRGQFQFGGVPVGGYGLEINDEKAYAAWLYFDMNSSREKIELPNTTLLQTTTLKGSLKSMGALAGIGAYIRVFGLERIAFADNQGDFSLQDMPTGNYSLRINVPAPYFDSVTLANTPVGAGLKTTVGNVNVPLKGCSNYSCDSLTVRSILDANGKMNITVASVTVKDKGSERIITLNLARMGLTVLPEEVGSLSALKTLNAPVNKLDSLPHSIVNLPVLEMLYLETNLLGFLPARLGEMSSLRELRLTQNKLSALPENIGALLSLETILLDSNQFSNLPESMVNLKEVKMIFTNGNKFCTPLSSALEAWVGEHSGDGVSWKFQQNCP